MSPDEVSHNQKPNVHPCLLFIFLFIRFYHYEYSCIYRVGQKSKPLLIYQQIVLKPADEATFLLKLNVEQIMVSKFFPRRSSLFKLAMLQYTWYGICAVVPRAVIKSW